MVRASTAIAGFIVVLGLPTTGLAAPGSFSLVGPVNGGWANATPTLRWTAASGATAYTLTIAPVTGPAFVKPNITATEYTLAPGEALAASGSPFVWHVTARDAAGATLDSSPFSFFLDTTPPDAFTLGKPESNAWLRTSDATFLWNAAKDTGSGVAKYRFYIDGALCGEAAPKAAPGIFLRQSSCSPADGTHLWSVAAEDGVGNVTWCTEAPGGVGGRPVALDSKGPDVVNVATVFKLSSSYYGPAPNQPNDRMINTGIYSRGEQVQVTSSGTWCYPACGSTCCGPDGCSIPGGSPSLVCKEGSVIGRIGSPALYVCLGSSYTFNLPTSVTLPYEQRLALGSNGYSGCFEETMTVTVSGGRSFNLLSPEDNALVGTARPELSWQTATDEGSGGITYLLFIDEVSDFAVLTSSSTTPAKPLADGPHTWYVRAIDAVDNRTESPLRHFTVDTTAPAAFRLKSPVDNACTKVPTPELCWNQPNDNTGVVRYDVWVDGALATPDGVTNTCTTLPTGFAQGMHAWYVVASDKVGNSTRSTDTSHLRVDYAPPDAPELTAPAAGTSLSDPPTFTWNAAADNEGIASYEVYVDGVVNGRVAGSIRTWLAPTDFALGAHSWYVRALDYCGQGTQSATWDFTVVACTPDGLSHSCPGSDQGRCQPGTRTCTAPGTWGACVGTIKPEIESCNGIDDDCNGIVDDGINQCGGACGLAHALGDPCDGDDADRCLNGLWRCSGLNTVACVEDTPVKVEICNGVDDDCNGIIDDSPACGAPPADGGVVSDAGRDANIDGARDSGLDIPLARDVRMDPGTDGPQITVPGDAAEAGAKDAVTVGREDTQLNRDTIAVLGPDSAQRNVPEVQSPDTSSSGRDVPQDRANDAVAARTEDARPSNEAGGLATDGGKAVAGGRGCSCRVGIHGSGTPSLLTVLALGLVLVRRRRR